MRLLLTSSIFLLGIHRAYALPNICTVVNAPQFERALEFRVKPSMCGWPIPRPCAHFTYNVPQYFIEVTSNPRESFFSSLPGVVAQLALEEETVPFGAEDDGGNYSFHAHTINVPFAAMGLYGLPCGGALWDRFCFSSMSEHLGSHWKTGSADLMQPAWLAWSASPKACLIKGALSSTTGSSQGGFYPSIGLCSFERSFMKVFPPSNLPVCSGWGINFPRYGTVQSSDQTTASLVIASRIKSLGAEVFQSIALNPSDRFQMIYPQSSSLFKEGQNVGALRVKGVSELGRILKGRPKNYLYVIWKKVHCTKDIPEIATSRIWLRSLKSACATQR